MASVTELINTRSPTRKHSVPMQRHFIALSVLAATLPLQWQGLGTYGLGNLRYFHFGATLFAITFVGARWATRTAHKTRRTWVPFGAAFVLYTAAALWATSLNDGNTVKFMQQAFYAPIGLLVALLLADATARRVVPKLAWWIGPIGLASFVWFFWLAMHTEGINALDIYVRAIIEADPEVVKYTLFQAAFSSTADDASQANWRHEIFGALLSLSWVSGWALTLRPPRRSLRVVLGACMFLTFVFVALSLSRSILLALVLAGLVPLSRIALTGRTRNRQPWRLMAGVLGGAILVPLFSLISNQFLVQTGSFEERVSGIPAALQAIGSSPLLGVGGDYDRTSHNFILDAWVNAGVLAALAALAFFLLLVREWWRLYKRYVQTGQRLFAIGLAAGLLPLTRMITAGGGTLHLAEWVSFGVFLGIVLARIPPLGRLDQ